MDATCSWGKQQRKRDPDWKHGSAFGQTTRYVPSHRNRYCSRETLKLMGCPLFDTLHVIGANGIIAPHVAANLNKHRRWELVPALLEDLAVSETERPDRAVPFYPAAPKERNFTVLTAEDPEEDAAEAPTRIFCRRHGGKPRPCGIVISPPAQVGSLPGKITAPLGVLKERVGLKERAYRVLNVKGALTSSSDYWDCYSPEQLNADTDFLQIDLGTECFVTHISTKGRYLLSMADERLFTSSDGCRYPHTEIWPGRQPDRRDANFSAEQLQDWQNNTAWLERQYGQLQCEVWDKDYEALQFVRRYEVSFRSEGGSWIKLPNVFSGNSDFHTEVTHSLHMYAPHGVGGLCARYLRFKPLSAAAGGFHGRKSMRIGVYGQCSDSGEMDVASDGPVQKTISVAGSSLVSYCRASGYRSTRRRQAGRGHNVPDWGRKCGKCDLYSKSRARKKRAYDVCVWNEDLCDSDYVDDEDFVGACSNSCALDYETSECSLAEYWNAAVLN